MLGSINHFFGGVNVGYDQDVEYETKALELLADRLEKITGKHDVDPESLRRVINNFRNKASPED